MPTETQTRANRPNAIRYTLYASRDTRDKRRATINMQNKPNSRKAKMKLTFYIAKDYENIRLHRGFKKQTQSNPTCSDLVEPISKGAPYCSAERCSGQVMMYYLGVEIAASKNNPPAGRGAKHYIAPSNSQFSSFLCRNSSIIRLQFN